MEKIRQKDGAIIFSIDTISIVFENAAIFDVFHALKLDDKYSEGYEAVLKDAFCTSLGYSTDLRFSMHGVGFQLRTNDLRSFYPEIEMIKREDPDVFFQIKLPYIRIDAMGGALDNLRSFGTDIEQLCFNPLDVPEDVTYHFTRCDFAFDLFDHQPKFIDELIDLCYSSGIQTPYGLGVLTGSRSVNVSIRTGDQKTVYIGKGRSDRCLRVYDKKMEYERSGSMNAEKFKFYDQLKYIPNSWIRIELQVRREQTCHTLLNMSEGDPLRIFRYIYDNYAIRLEPGNNKPVAAAWLNLFDWEVIPRIIQNANCSVLYMDPVERARDYLYNTMPSVLISVIANYGYDAIREHLNNLLELWQSDPEFENKWARLRYRTFNPKSPPKYLHRNAKGIYFI